MIKLRSVDQLKGIEGKRVLVRSDFDVPLKEVGGGWVVADGLRLKANGKTIDYLIKHRARIILAGQVDRPQGKRDLAKSSFPIFEFYRNRYPGVSWIDDGLGEKVEAAVKNLKEGGILILENLRFYPGEEARDLNFAKSLARLADFYVNEDFSNCHRDHASMTLLPSLLPSGAGFNLINEVQTLSGVLERPKQPLMVLIGGSKIETKLPTIKNFLDKADRIFVGGLPGCQAEILSKLGQKVIFSCGDPDLSFNTAKVWATELLKAKTIFWNGPMGNTSQGQLVGTELIANSIAEATRAGARSFVGGGDTEAYLRSVGLSEQITFISTGGGAMLEFLGGIELPALKPLIIK